ncbi:uncharacterized protein LOC134794546 [Cydia splendana]|uniref:uncharacterized protein LOC134794546 n=1 Tax=Cydia splendana TaxID=1100963 RepID=UPI00300C906F
MPQPDITNPDYIKFFIESCEKTARLRQKWNTLHQEKLQQAAVLTRPDKNLTDIEVIKQNMIGGLGLQTFTHSLDATTRDFITSGYNRRRTPIRDTKTIPGIESLRKEHSIPAVGLGDPKKDPRLGRPDTDLRPDPIMKPVDPAHTEILFKPKPFFGRLVYIKNREKIKPEDRCHNPFATRTMSAPIQISSDIRPDINIFCVFRYYFAEKSGWDYGWRLKDTPFGSVGAPRTAKVYRLFRDQMSRVGPQPDPYYYNPPVKTMMGPCDG